MGNSCRCCLVTSPQMGTYATQLPCLSQMGTTTFMSPPLLGEVPSVPESELTAGGTEGSGHACCR